jgi:heat-inducible transcriptional repressor
MADLEEAGLLYAPHTSAGRLPTERGLSLFVSGLLELGGLSKEERENIDGKCAAAGRSLADVLEDATTMLSGLSRCAGLVVAPKTERRLKHIEFVHLGPGRALVVMVTEDGLVENRIIDVPIGLPPSSLVEATNYMTARLVGRTLNEARAGVLQELDRHRAELDALTSRVVEAGLATWAGEKKGGALIIRGQAHLLDEVTALSDLERIRALFAALETKEAMVRLLEAADLAQGVQIFIGSQNELFGLAGCSMIIAPYRNSREQIVGAVGVIGPTRINYARIIPMVDYTAQVIGRILA